MSVRKIAVIGPESTGKSTLCADIAGALNTVWTEEYARAYLAQRQGDYDEHDLLNIALGQLQAEDKLLARAYRFLICDTDLYVIKVWSEHRFGHCAAPVLQHIATRPYDLYLLTYTDVPWQDDPLREHPDPDMRAYFFQQYKDVVINSGVPWQLIKGNRAERLQLALAAISATFG